MLYLHKIIEDSADKSYAVHVVKIAKMLYQVTESPRKFLNQ